MAAGEIVGGAGAGAGAGAGKAASGASASETVGPAKLLFKRSKADKDDAKAVCSYPVGEPGSVYAMGGDLSGGRVGGLYHQHKTHGALVRICLIMDFNMHVKFVTKKFVRAVLRIIYGCYRT